MPYNPGTGIYTLPAIYLAVPGTTIIAAQHNTPLEDLEVANNYARPIVAGGTGQNSAVLARGSTGLATEGNIGSKGTNITSAAALTLVDNFNYFHVTGTVAVTSITTRPAGQRILLEFEGALVLTHNATSLILPGGHNILTYAGYVAEFVSEGGGNWRLADPANMSNVSASLSGTTFTIAVPPGAKKITLAFSGPVSFSGTGGFNLKLGDSGGVESAGYVGTMSTLTTAAAVAAFSTQFILSGSSGSIVVSGIVELALSNITGVAPTWSYRGGMAIDAGTTNYIGAGAKTLTTELTTLELNAGGASAFTFGKVTAHFSF